MSPLALAQWLKGCLEWRVVRSLFGVTIMLHLHTPVTVTSHPRLEPLVVELSPAEHRGRCLENTRWVDGKTKKLLSRQVSLFLSFSVAAFLLHSLSLCKCVCWGCVCVICPPFDSLSSLSLSGSRSLGLSLGRSGSVSLLLSESLPLLLSFCLSFF